MYVHEYGPGCAPAHAGRVYIECVDRYAQAPIFPTGNRCPLFSTGGSPRSFRGEDDHQPRSFRRGTAAALYPLQHTAHPLLTGAAGCSVP
eukprot:196503-Rhodomonas_salina.1